MSIRLKSSLFLLFNCVLLELISGQMHEVIHESSQMNLTFSQSMPNSANNSLTLDILHFNQITLETIANSSVNICDDIDCTKNIAICEQNRCLPSKRIRRAHYIVTFLIVLVIIGLMLTTLYACHKDSKKRLNRWHNTCNAIEEQMIAIRLIQSLDSNTHLRNNSPIIHEIIPLNIPNESPPPYQCNYTPPPNYEEAVRCPPLNKNTH